MKSTFLKYITCAAVLALAAGAQASPKQAPSGGAEHGDAAQPAKAAAPAEHGAPAKPAKAAASAKRGGGKKAGGGHGGPQWGYEGEEGPENWGRLSQDFRACESGRMQSPIDIAGGVAANGDAIEFDYNLTPLSIVHNGHTIQVNYRPGSSITVGGNRYELLQFHFHTPSEHAVGHARAAMEVHFVHKNATGQLAVVGALMQAGGENMALREIWASMPKKAGPVKVNKQVLVNGRDLLPRDRSYYRYMGSLTTPPCSEGVNWYFLTQPITVSMEQVEWFAKAVGENARPLQALNHRLLLSPDNRLDISAAAGDSPDGPNRGIDATR